MEQKKTFKDPLCEGLTVNEFFKKYNYFAKTGFDYFENMKELDEFAVYFQFTEKYLVSIETTFTLTNFGMNSKPKINHIYVAERNGKEKEILVHKMLSLKGNSKAKMQIKNIKEALNCLPSFGEKFITEHHKFDDYLIDLGYRTTIKGNHECLVLDLETNGLRTKNDDILSISIYDPQSGLCYNRFLPLDLQPIVLTTWINGIKTSDLSRCDHLTQEELDELISRFKLKERRLFVYSGGNGSFDITFLKNYCKRHNLVGLDDLQPVNIKNLLPDPGFGYDGFKTKDNYCKLFGVEGIQNIHSGANDCLLEWKLFECLIRNKPFFNNGNLYSFSDNYIVPVTYLIHQPLLRQYKKIDIKYILGIPKLVYSYKYPNSAVRKMRRFPTNITGISLENALYSLINPISKKDIEFLSANKSNCKFLGRLESNLNEIPIVPLDDGTIQSLNPLNDEYVNDVNDVAEVFIKYSAEPVNFIKSRIFSNKSINREEIIISDDGKILSVCDLSNDEAVLEIKTGSVTANGVHDRFDFEHLRNEYALQLYYERKNRKTFILSIRFDYEDLVTLKGVSLDIYSVELEDKTEEAKTLRPKLWITEEEVLNLIKKDLHISLSDLSKQVGRSLSSIKRSVNLLINWGYIKRISRGPKSDWEII